LLKGSNMQHDMNIANQGFPAFRSDLNDALAALVSNSSGSTEPSTTFADQFWLDTSASPSVLKIRNADNDAWITVGNIDQSSDTFNLPIAQGGTGADTAADARTALGAAALAVAQTFTAKQTFGNTVKIEEVLEKMSVSATAATSTINFDTLSQAALYYTSDATGNWTLNVRGDSGTTLDTVMATGESLTIVFLVTQGATAYYNSAFQIDGSAVTPKWLGGDAPTEGNASGVDAYTYAIVKTGSAAFTVFASVAAFA
jgi:hypothetical protein